MLLLLLLLLSIDLLGRGPLPGRTVYAQEPDGGVWITHGVASGDVTAHSAVVWARANRAGVMHVEHDADPEFVQPALALAEATTRSDFTAQVRLDDLLPDTPYAYRVWFVAFEGEQALVSPVETGGFRTAPDGASARPISFVFSGDVGGQEYCRRVDLGYPIFSAMLALAPDFFIAQGDMVYADYDCPAKGPADEPDWSNVPGDFREVDHSSVDWTDPDAVREVYLRRWRYNRADPHQQALLRWTPIYAQWDDHEVISDFGGEWPSWPQAPNRAGFPNLVEAGRQALFDYTPMEHLADDPQRIYRSFTYGRDLELFILDARSYRSPNDLPDTDEHAKTLLGHQQLEWLKAGLAASRATWKVVANSTSLSVPTGVRQGAFGRDSFANGTDSTPAAQTGFERELLGLLAFVDRQDVENVVFIVADAHFPQILLYETDYDGDGDLLVFHQLQVGPLSANREEHRELDPTLQPTLLYAESKLFNFGYARIVPRGDGPASFVYDVRGDDGLPRPGSELELRAR